MFKEEYFEIRVKGHLNGQANLLENRLTVRQEDSEAILSGAITNQEEIVDLLNQVHGLGLTIQSFNHVQPQPRRSVYFIYAGWCAMTTGVLATFNETRKGLTIIWDYKFSLVMQLLGIGMIYLGALFFVGNGEITQAQLSSSIIGFIISFYSLNASVI